MHSVRSAHTGEGCYLSKSRRSRGVLFVAHFGFQAEQLNWKFIANFDTRAEAKAAIRRTVAYWRTHSELRHRRRLIECYGDRIEQLLAVPLHTNPSHYRVSQ